jgi:hypothetical protein
MACLNQAGMKVAQTGRNEADVWIVAVRFPGYVGEKNFHGEKKSGSKDPDIIFGCMDIQIIFQG